MNPCRVCGKAIGTKFEVCITCDDRLTRVSLQMFEALQAALAEFERLRGIGEVFDRLNMAPRVKVLAALKAAKGEH